LLPEYNSMRQAQRFKIVFMLALAVFAGFGLHTAQTMAAKKTHRPGLAQLFAAGVLGLALLDLISVSAPIFKQAFPHPPSTHPPKPNSFIRCGISPRTTRMAPSKPALMSRRPI
jgi:hypothetical protein